jgi:hypothetical protein
MEDSLKFLRLRLSWTNIHDWKGCNGCRWRTRRDFWFDQWSVTQQHLSSNKRFRWTTRIETLTEKGFLRAFQHQAHRKNLLELNHFPTLHMHQIVTWSSIWCLALHSSSTRKKNKKKLHQTLLQNLCFVWKMFNKLIFSRSEKFLFGLQTNNDDDDEEPRRWWRWWLWCGMNNKIRFVNEVKKN